MDNIIKEIMYCGNDCEKMVYTPEYIKKEKKCNEAESALSATFYTKQLELFNKFYQSFTEMLYEECSVNYVRGFRKGARTVIDVFSETE